MGAPRSERGAGMALEDDDSATTPAESTEQAESSGSAGRVAAFVPILQFSLNRVLKAEYLGPDRGIFQPVDAQAGDDASNALAPERVGRGTMNGIELVGQGTDQRDTRMKRKSNNISHERHHCRSWFTIGERRRNNVPGSASRAGVYRVRSLPAGRVAS